MNALHRLADEASFHGHDYHGLDVQPQAAEAATEVGAEPLIPINTRLTRREAWGLVAIMAGPWAVIAAIAFLRLL